jgi:hypothetical protein
MVRTTTLKKWEKDKGTIEKIVDKRSVGEVLEMLSEMSFEKAMHLREAWQDEVSAKTWEKTAYKLEKLQVVV